MAKQPKGKQKQAKKASETNVQPTEHDIGAMGTVEADARPYSPTNSGQGNSIGAWGTANTAAMGGWGTSDQHENEDAWADHAGSLLQRPSHNHGVLPTIPEQASGSYNQFGQSLSAIGESRESRDYSSSYGGREDSPNVHFADGQHMQNSTPAGASSAMGTPAPPPPAPIAEVLSRADAHSLVGQKMSSASEAARRLEEQRSRLHAQPAKAAVNSPAQQFEPLKDHLRHMVGGHTPMSSASAAAALHESTTNRLKAQSHKPPQPIAPPAPGKTAWTYPKPLVPGARPPAHIPPDPSWTMTGGNAWSNKHRQTKSATVHWTPVNGSSWNQQPPQHFPNASLQGHTAGLDNRPRHQNNHSHPVHSAFQQAPSTQNTPWQGWGKDQWNQEESESDTEYGTMDDEYDGPGNEGGWNQNSGGRGQHNRHHNHHREQMKAGGSKHAADGWGDSTGWAQQSGHWDQRAGGWSQVPHNDGWSQGKGQGQGQANGRGRGQGQGQGAAHPRSDNGWHQPEGNGWSREKGWDKEDAGWDKNDTGWGKAESGWGKAETGWGKAGNEWDKADTGWDKTEEWKKTETGWGQAEGDPGEWGKTTDDNGWGQGKGEWQTGRTSPIEWAGQSKAGGHGGPELGTKNQMAELQRAQILNAMMPSQTLKNSNMTTAQLRAAHSQAAHEQARLAAQGLQLPADPKTKANAIWEAYDTDNGWGSMDSSDEEYDPNRRVRFEPKASGLLGGSPHSVPSKTLAYAQQQQGSAAISVNVSSGVRFVESKGAAFSFVNNAFFGNSRFARERIHWMFPSNKDKRVADTLAWVQKMSFNLATFGLLKFLQTRERGALFLNVIFRMTQFPQEPAFDWLTFDQLQSTMDKTLQESVAFYDPSRIVTVFVYLPSQTGNSVAIWRRKINVPDSARIKYQTEVSAIVKNLRPEKDYVVMVDELPKTKPKVPQKRQLRKSVKKAKVTKTTTMTTDTEYDEKPKKRKWWRLFLC